jgi:hypothetical protein
VEVLAVIMDKRYTGGKETVKLFVDAVQFRRGLSCANTGSLTLSCLSLLRR